MRRRIGRPALVASIIGLVLSATPPSSAIHLFPSFPGDPTGDCAAGLEPDPETADARVVAEGFFFIDEADGDNTVEIEAGQTITWEWIQYCHSVTSESVPEGAQPFTTSGGPGSATGPVEGQDELLKPEGDNSTYTLALTVPGTYEYFCVHHASVGMRGTIEVAPVAAEQQDEQPDGERDGEDEQPPTDDGPGRDGRVLGAPVIPATGGGAVAPGIAIATIALVFRRLLR